MSKFNTLQEEFEYIAKNNPDEPGKLDTEQAVDYALAHKDSLIREYFPNKDEAARAHYTQIVNRLIYVHYVVIPAESKEPIRAWGRALPQPGSGLRAKGYYPTEEILANPDRRLDLVRAEIERLWSVWKSYKLSELQEVADTLEVLRVRYAPPPDRAVA